MVIPENLVTETTVLVLIAVVVILLCQLLIGGSLDKEDTVRHVLTVERRSVEKYDGAADKSQIMSALECAIAAPNHFLTEPWRFRLLGKKGKEKLGELAAKFKSNGSFGSVPDYLVVSIAKIKARNGKTADFENWNMNALEDHAAVSCAIQNFMLACASMGLATKWMTGKMGIAGNVILKECCGISEDEGEHYMGTIFVGEPAVPTEDMKVPERKTGLNDPVFVQCA